MALIEGTESLSIGALLEHRAPFSIPPYQRAYAWGSEEIDEFLDDLRALYEGRRAGATGRREHFFGGVVSAAHRLPGAPDGHRYEIVDGQQRIATFIILLAAIVSRLKALADLADEANTSNVARRARRLAADLQARYLDSRSIPGSDPTEMPPLTLSDEDNAYFQQLLMGANPRARRASHRALAQALQKTQRMVKEIIDQNSTSFNTSLQAVRHLTDAVTNDCQIVHIISTGREAAYRLFRVLNDRGKHVTDGDLLRSYTLETLQGHSVYQRAVSRHWDRILRRRETDVDRFLRSYYTSMIGERPPTGDLFDKFRRDVLNISIPSLTEHEAASLQQSIESIEMESDTHASIIRGVWPYDEPTVSEWDQDRLSRLIGPLKNSLCIPLLLSAARHLSDAIFSQIVNLLERFTFRYIIVVGAHLDPVSREYYKHAKKIRENPDGYRIRELENDLRSLIQASAQDTIFRAQLAENFKYTQTTQQKNYVKYFLTTLEDHYLWFSNGAPGRQAPDRTRSFDLKQINIDHIYPQNTRPPVGDMEPTKHSIGNLTPWIPRENELAGDADFETKKPRYARSSIRLTQELASIPRWDAQAVQQRQAKLLRMALKIFSV